MQLTIQDGILYIRTSDRMVYVECINVYATYNYFITCGYRPLAAQAIACGALVERQSTITLAQLLKLLAISPKNDERST